MQGYQYIQSTISALKIASLGKFQIFFRGSPARFHFDISLFRQSDKTNFVPLLWGNYAS
jgi:hypothetical protein